MDSATFPRHPSLSPDGSNVAFSYAGDIWRASADGGLAQRLTVHPAHEHSPRWSPDGRWIAFSANREGYDDMYVMPAGGGQSKRLTFIDAGDQVCGWTPDSRYVIFHSRRDDRYLDLSMIYRVSLDGGTPQKVMDAYGEDASIAPGGSSMLYTRRGVRWWQRNYRGSASNQVWLYDLSAGVHVAVTDTGAHDAGDDFLRPSSRWALWGTDGSIYVVSDRDQARNLWKRGAAGNWRQLTHFKGDSAGRHLTAPSAGLRFPSISYDGRTIAFEHELGIYLMRDESTPFRIDIRAPLDDPQAGVTMIKYIEKAQRLAFTPDGKQMFLDVRGDVFAGRIVGEEGEAAQGRSNLLSGEYIARDGDFTVSPTGDSLAFVSDGSGSRDLYLVYSDDPGTRELARALKLRTERLTSDSREDHMPIWSPDGRKIAFVRGKGDLFVYDLGKKSLRRLLAGWGMQQYAWSPDGRWIAFSRYDNEYNSDVFIMSVDDRLEREAGDMTGIVNVSRHPDEDEMPVWSKDGGKLAFRSRRRENNWDLYFVFLKLSDYQKSVEDWAEIKRAKMKSEGDDKTGDKDKKKDAPPELPTVQIDTTDIYLRVQAVTNLPGAEGQFDVSPDGENFAFSADHEGKRDLYTIDWMGKDLKRLTKSGASPSFVSYADDGKRIRYLTQRGRVASIASDGKDEKDHPFDARVEVSLTAERRQKFGEIWRTLNDEFYDPNFHGRDWQLLRDEYSSYLDHASCEEDFADLVRMMFGELNASHMGYYPPDPERTHNTGRLGLDFDFTAGGPGYLIDHVQKNGPCDREEARIKAGERLVAVNGVALEGGVNLHELLGETVGERVDLTVMDGRKERRLIVRPMSKYRQGDIRYDEFVDGRRVVVDSLSGGRLGYLHIRGMGEASLARFEAELYSVSAGKEGLVIDVRYNGGGWTTDWLLTMLQVRRHAVTFPRDGGPGYPQTRLPLYSWTKPIIALCNEHSYSNAEIFSHAMKMLGRGTLVGIPTPGAVISTGGAGLLDGSSFRIPLRGWYVGSDPTPDPGRNMEGNGAVPDVIVNLAPGRMAAGEDGQLEAAVMALIKQIERR